MDALSSFTSSAHARNCAAPFGTARCAKPSRQPLLCRAVSDETRHLANDQQAHRDHLSRRQAILSAAAVIALPTLSFPACAQSPGPPPGYRIHQDKLDGYRFQYPQSWTPVTTSGNEIFYRNPYDVNECLFVNLSSPSSSKYKSVRSIGSPDVVAEKARKQYLRDMMSTRLGVKRETNVVSASDRTGPDGHEYYDLQVRMKSYASRAQLAVTQAEIDAAMELEWDRRLITVLGSANNRLYEFRLQTANSTYEASKEPLLEMARSFTCFPVET